MPKFLPSIVQAVVCAALIAAAFVIVPGGVHAKDIKGPIAVQFKAMTLPASPAPTSGGLEADFYRPLQAESVAAAAREMCGT